MESNTLLRSSTNDDEKGAEDDLLPQFIPQSIPHSKAEAIDEASPSSTRKEPSPPSNPPSQAVAAATEIKRPSSVINAVVPVPAVSSIMAPVISSPLPATATATTTTTANHLLAHHNEQIRNEQIEAARIRIFNKVTEKYPNRPLEFRMRKVNKQMAAIYPEAAPAPHESSLLDTPNMSTSAQDSVDGTAGQYAPNGQSTAVFSPAETTARDLDDEEHRSLYGRNPKLNSIIDSTTRESSQMQDVIYGSRSAVQLPAIGTNGAYGNGNGSAKSEVDSDDADRSAHPRDQFRTSSQVEKLKSKGVLMGFYRLSEVEDDRNKHAVYGKIDKGGDLFTTVSKETRYGEPVGTKQYLASKVQCHSEKIAFELHLDGLNKAQLKAYVVRRLEIDWGSETEQGRRASELQIADEVRRDPSLTEKGVVDTKKLPTVITAGMKRAYEAFAEEDDVEDDEESPLSEVDEHLYRESDDEDAFVPSGAAHKKRKSGRKSINARPAKGQDKETEDDDIKNGVCIGVWRLSPAEEKEDKHAVYSYLDARDSLWSRVFHVSRAGDHIEMPIPFPRGTVKWEDVILDDHLSELNREGVKEYVRNNRRIPEGTPVGDYALKKDRKPRKSNGDQGMKQDLGPTSRISKANSILLGYWKLSTAEDEAEKNAVFGYVDTSDRFNLQVRKHTRDGKDLAETNIHFPGNGRVQASNVIMEEHLKDLVGAEIQSFTRKALEIGVPALESHAQKEAELMIVAEILAARKNEPEANGRVNGPDQPRQKRKYTKRKPRNPSLEVTENTLPHEASGEMHGPSRPPSGMGQMFDPSMGYGGYQGPPLPPMPTPALVHGPNGSLILNGVKYHPRLPQKPAEIDEDAKTIIHDGLKFSMKSTGAFKGKFVHSYRQLVSINGDDYAEYRVLGRTDV